MNKPAFQLEAIFFDLDGTLWDSVEGISTSWQKAVARYPELDIHFTDADVRACMGMPLDEIAANLMPGIETSRRLRLMEECIEEEHIYLREHGGKLYPRLEETLSALSRRYALFIASNCEQGYIENFLELNRLDAYFRDHISFGDTGKKKGPNVCLLMEKHDIRKAILVGDAIVDQLAADYAQIPFLWASYGFGQVEHYDLKLSSLEQLLEVLD